MECPAFTFDLILTYAFGVTGLVFFILGVCALALLIRNELR